MLDQINRLEADEAETHFRRCCGTVRWCQMMAAKRPFANMEAIHHSADAIMDTFTETEWLEAFACHPQIGDLQSLKMKFLGNREWSTGEQSGMQAADEATLVEFANKNATYRDRFGFIFIVCATGKSAHEMLKLLSDRLGNSRSLEIDKAADEQRKITHLRLDKLEIKCP